MLVPVVPDMEILLAVDLEAMFVIQLVKRAHFAAGRPLSGIVDDLNLQVQALGEGPGGLLPSRGVADRIDLVKKDYRDLKGTYSKLVSIEMIEAVGHHYLNAYFQSCSRLLKPDGMMLLQAITIADQVYERHKYSVDFIKRYIFPGSCIPSIAAITASIARVTDLRLFHLEDITPHYAKTLARWREQFFRNIDDVKRLGYSEAFIRMWDFYLSYCEAGFAERYIGDVQMLFNKPMCRCESLIPALAAK